MSFNRTVFFNLVRDSLFNGGMSQQQVDGMNFKMDVWEREYEGADLRWLAYPFATSMWETGSRMYPVREGFAETDAQARKLVKEQGREYASVDPVTGQVYYGRGDVQMTWAENYKKAGKKLGVDLYTKPDLALDPAISADAMYMGMSEGWYRGDENGRQTLSRYFDNNTDDAYGAREIINGDKTKIPSWSGGVNVGNYIKSYHTKFLTAFQAALVAPVPVPPEPIPTEDKIVTVIVPPGVKVVVKILDA